MEGLSGCGRRCEPHPLSPFVSGASELLRHLTTSEQWLIVQRYLTITPVTVVEGLIYLIENSFTDIHSGLSSLTLFGANPRFNIINDRLKITLLGVINYRLANWILLKDVRLYF